MPDIKIIDRTSEFKPIVITSYYYDNKFHVTRNEDRYVLDIFRQIASKNGEQVEYQIATAEVNDILNKRHSFSLA